MILLVAAPSPTFLWTVGILASINAAYHSSPSAAAEKRKLKVINFQPTTPLMLN